MEARIFIPGLGMLDDEQMDELLLEHPELGDALDQIQNMDFGSDDSIDPEVADALIEKILSNPTIH